MNTVLVAVEVTREDIENGVVFHADKCPVNLAIRRVLHEGIDAIVYQSGVEFYRGEERVGKSIVPDLVCAWIKKLDNDDKSSVSPFSFNLEVPTEVAR